MGKHKHNHNDKDCPEWQDWMNIFERTLRLRKAIDDITKSVNESSDIVEDKAGIAELSQATCNLFDVTREKLQAAKTNIHSRYVKVEE